jgi:hypothetical protein
MAIYITVAERRLQFVNSVHSRGTRHRHAPRRPLSAWRVVERAPTRQRIRGVQYIDGSSPSYDRHHYIRTTNAIYSSLFQSSTIPLPAARGCPRLGRLAISDDYTTLYFSSIAMEESGLRPWSRAPELG